MGGGGREGGVRDRWGVFFLLGGGGVGEGKNGVLFAQGKEDVQVASILFTLGEGEVKTASFRFTGGGEEQRRVYLLLEENSDVGSSMEGVACCGTLPCHPATFSHTNPLNISEI